METLSFCARGALLREEKTMFDKLIAILMIPFLFIQTLFPAFHGAGKDTYFKNEDLTSLYTLADYVNYIYEKGAPAYSTASFFQTLKPADTLRRILHGQVLSAKDEAYLDVEVEGAIQDTFNYILENTGLDIEGILTHVPNGNWLAEFCAEGLHLNTTAFREKLYAMRDEEYAQNDGSLRGAVLWMLGAYFSVIDHVRIYPAPTRDPDVVVLTLDVTYRDGTVETMTPNVHINLKTGHMYNPGDIGMMGLGFDMELYDLVIYATVNSWQRNLGFMLLYDILANSSPAFNYVTRRYRFEYSGKDWMIQSWKGNYALATNGAEVGLYNREKGKLGTFYNCASDDEMLMMTLELYHGDDLLFKIGPMKHWWINGFKISDTIYTPSVLTMKYTIEMPDTDMLRAFAAAIDANLLHDATYTVDGLTITVTW